jgi:carbon-monoxide dehydrogenase small subunit
MTRIALTVNGKPITAEVAPRTHLADFLREQLHLTGTHIGCEHGICGACTVEIDGEIARSCITYAVACDGARVRTIEGFDDDALMGRLREAFTAQHALQCGYCTPGMLVAARDLVRRKRGLSRPDIRTEMSGNLCRCTGYVGIVSAIEAVMAADVIPVSPVVPGAPVIPAPSVIPGQAGIHASAWLGPAPGPGRDSDEPATRPKPTLAMASAPTSVARSAPPSAAPIRVTVGAIEEVDGATQITQSFVLPHSRDAVWALLSDPQAVARCMPGMSLDGPPQGERLAGRLQVKIGPITANFAGEGTLKQIAADHRQIIEGGGGDRRSGSRATGSADMRLTPVAGGAGEAWTGVDVAMRYALTGPLAQFGRAAIVRDLVRRIGEVFAQNVDAQLRAPGAVVAQAKLGGVGLLFAILADRIRAAVASILGRQR